MELTISIRDLHRLVDPVTPFASKDPMIPVLNCVRVESTGTHLLAFTTDRFRLACKRVAAPEGVTWPEWSATIPLATLRSLFQTYKAKRLAEPVISLKVDGDALSVHGDEALVDLLDASVTYPLSDGEYPKIRGILRDALDDEAEDEGGDCSVNQKFLADFAHVTSSPVMHMRVRGTKKPILFADGEDFIGLLMPRRLIGNSEGLDQFPGFESWDALLAPQPAKKKARSKTNAA